MDALVMCGGRGTRLASDAEKPLVEVAGVRMVDRVLAALAASRIEDTYAVVSSHTPETRAHLAGDIPTVETPGEGYVADLQRALADQRVDQPVLTVAADLPLLDGDLVDRVLDAHDAGSLTVAVSADRKRELGVSVDTTFEHDGRDLAPAGVNVVDETDSDEVDSDGTLVVEDAGLAVNVNRADDRAIAERLLE